LPWPVEMLAATEQGTAGHLSSELRLPAHCSELHLARSYAREAALSFGLDADRSYEFVYAVNEAVTNAIRHGAPDEWGDICLSIVSDDARLTCVVRDYGTFVTPSPETTATAMGGRGFGLIASLMDDFQLCIEPGCTTVRLSMVRSPAGALARGTH
jgi:anti-sigma regulatory factor (Ser/Thr protein kinase)